MINSISEAVRETKVFSKNVFFLQCVYVKCKACKLFHRLDWAGKQVHKII